MSVAYVIQWSLLGSYICFITTQLTTVDVFIAEDTVQLVGTKLQLWVRSIAPELSNWFVLPLCTVLCSSLNMHLQQVSLVSRSWSLVGTCDLQQDSLLQCSRQLERFYIWDRSTVTKRKILKIKVVSHTFVFKMCDDFSRGSIPLLRLPGFSVATWDKYQLEKKFTLVAG